MKSTRRTWWTAYALCSLALIFAMSWITMTVLQLEHREQQARHESKFQSEIRLALWRMDSWLAPRLARESARPYFEYLPYYPQQRAYTRLLNEIDPNEVLTPSPLLTQQTDLIPLHFQMTSDGELQSPQALKGNYLDLASTLGIDMVTNAGNIARLDELDEDLSQEMLFSCVPAPDESAQTDEIAMPLDEFVEHVEEIAAESVAQDEQPQQVKKLKDEVSRTKAEAIKRQQGADWARQGAQSIQSYAPVQQQIDVTEGLQEEIEAPYVAIGALTPFWLAQDDDKQKTRLLFARRVNIGDDQIFQGFETDWPSLRGQLLEQIADLFPQASLVPVRGASLENDHTGRLLATIPARLEVTTPALPSNGMFSPARTTLLITWLAIAAAVAAAGVTLHASIIYGEKRSRFASAVTHELRTPLTTFRMYSDMLAEGMVTDESTKKEYLHTLRDESDRLSSLVENVLSYARVERGAAAKHCTMQKIVDVIDPMRGQLDERVRQAGMALFIDLNDAADCKVFVDHDALAQILANLIDNACKYASNSEPSRIDIACEVHEREVLLRVRDYGPGVPSDVARRVFAPFDRGAIPPGDVIPGIGLGLALSRELARAMGGDLRLDACEQGACFTLSLVRV